MWTMYGANLAFVLGALVVLGACGWWAVAPLRRQLAYSLVLAPLAGMVLVSIGSLAVTVVFRADVRVAAVTTILALCAGSLASARLDRDDLPREWALPLVAAVVVSAGAVWFVTRTDLFFGSPGLLYLHGTDHLGYAHVADWLRLRPDSVATTPSPDDWYGSWPQLMFLWDPRFGSFMLLAVVSVFSGRPGAFAYDLASAVVLAAAALGVAALFARRRSTFAVLTAALFTGFWFDWNRAGYLGKTTGYPATILAAGLFLAWVTRLRREGPPPLLALAAVAALTAGAAVMFSGLVTALFLALLGLTFLAATALAPAEPGMPAGVLGLRDPVVALVLLVALGILSSGIIARPLFYFGRFPLPWSWRDLLVHAVELEGLMPGRTGLPSAAQTGLALALLAAWIGLAGLAVRHRVPVAAAALTAPLLLLAGLYAADLRWHAMNFIGIYGALLLGGTAALLDGVEGPSHRRGLRLAVLAFLLIGAASHLPRFAATAAFQGGRDTPPPYRFSSREADALAAAILREGGSALVDTGGAPHFSIFLLIELGRRGIPLQFTERSWKPVLGYRPWPVPTYQTPAPLRIVTRTEGSRGGEAPILRTTQYELLVHLVERIDNPNGLEGWGGWLGTGPITISLLAGPGRALTLSFEAAPGPSRPETSRRTLVVQAGARPLGRLEIDGPTRVAIPFVTTGSREVLTLSTPDLPTVAVAPNGDTRPLLVSIRELTVTRRSPGR
jgi:hypothetical protein